MAVQVQSFTNNNDNTFAYRSFLTEIQQKQKNVPVELDTVDENHEVAVVETIMLFLIKEQVVAGIHLDYLHCKIAFSNTESVIFLLLDPYYSVSRVHSFVSYFIATSFLYFGFTFKNIVKQKPFPSRTKVIVLTRKS